MTRGAALCGESIAILSGTAEAAGRTCGKEYGGANIDGIQIQCGKLVAFSKEVMIFALSAKPENARKKAREPFRA